MFENKKIFILGMARSGYQAAKVLAKRDNQITLYDEDEQDIDKINELKALGVNVIIGNLNNFFPSDFDYVVKNPGIHLDHEVIIKAEEYNIPVINELEVAYHLFPKNIDIIGITGSNGKTTTSTLIYEVLSKGDRSVHLAGNIGFPLISFLDKVHDNDIIVCEISNYQLYNFIDFKTNISVLTNLSPAHIDFHGTYDNYKNTKKKIFNYHTKSDLALINKGNSDSLELTRDINSSKVYFSAKEKGDIYLENNNIVYNDRIIVNTNDIRIKGNHNYENIMCAIVIGLNYGINIEQMQEVFSAFKGVEHRIEFVKEINGIKIYNDSKSTNNAACITALSAFAEPVNIIMGGLDRGQDFNELEPYMSHVKHISCFGESKDRILEFANKYNITCNKFTNLEEATMDAYNNSKNGDIILLSPACASWDQYKCFEDRGDEFKSIINGLIINEL